MQLVKIKLPLASKVAILLAVLSFVALKSANANDAQISNGNSGASLVVNDYMLVRKQSRHADADETIFAVTEFKVDYQNNQLTRFSEYPNGVDNLSANTVYKFDQSGNLVSQLDIDDKGTSSRREFVYDEAGQLISLNGYMASNGNQNSAWEYHYRDDGKLDRKVETSGEPAKAKVFAYSAQGNLKSVTHQRGGQNGKLETTYIERFEHHQKSGQITRQESFGPDGKSFGVSSTYHYDQHGNMVQIKWYRGDELTHTDQFFYALKQRPVFNYWLHIGRFFPEWMRYEV